MPVGEPKNLFVALRDAPERRAALKAPEGAADRYRLYGIDQLSARGVAIRHNLEWPAPAPLWARAAATAINRVLYGLGGYGGDLAPGLPPPPLADRADVVLAPGATPRPPPPPPRPGRVPPPPPA